MNATLSLIIDTNVDTAESLLSEKRRRSSRAASDEVAGSSSFFHRVRALVQAAESFEEMLTTSMFAFVDVVIVCQPGRFLSPRRAQ
jgi:hypothetical protein